MNEGYWGPDDLRRAFVAGAKWWELCKTGGTMWPADRDKAEAEAESRYPGGRVPDPERDKLAERVRLLEKRLNPGMHDVARFYDDDAALEQEEK